MDHFPSLFGVVVTAMNTQAGHAHYLAEGGAHYILAVKASPPTLLEQLSSVPWGLALALGFLVLDALDTPVYQDGGSGTMAGVAAVALPYGLPRAEVP